jgi:hypothetical protein
VHNLIGFFKSTLTVPKVKDLVNAPVQKYEDIFNVLSNSKTISSNTYLPDSDVDLKPNVASMKNELKSFLKNKLKGAGDKGNTNDNTTSISSLDLAGSNSLSYSAY